MVKSSKQYKKEEEKYQKEVAIIKERQNNIKLMIEQSRKKAESMKKSWCKRRMSDLKKMKSDNGQNIIEKAFQATKKKDSSLTLKEYIKSIEEHHQQSWDIQYSKNYLCNTIEDVCEDSEDDSDYYTESSEEEC